MAGQGYRRSRRTPGKALTGYDRVRPDLENVSGDGNDGLDDGLHPHAFRHACGVELLKRSGGNLRAVQEHLRHADIQTTTIYTRLAPHDLQKVVNLFDEKNGGAAR